MSPRKILIFSLSYYPLGGGAEMAIKEITRRISNEKFQFDLITLRFSNSHPKFERLGNIDIYRVGGGLGYLSKIIFIPQAALFASRRKYDIYWSMMTYMVFPVALLRIFFGKKVPYILTLQDGDPFTHVFNRLRILIFKPLLTYGFRYVGKVQAISNFLAGWAREMGYTGEVEVIPNGVDVKAFNIEISHEGRENIRKKLGIEHGDIVLTSSSRLVKKNAMDDVIRSLKFLPENVKFVNFGHGSDRNMLQRLVEENGVKHRVQLLGYPDNDLPKYFKSCDIFIRPSLSEGQGISFLEGMASGLPVIATPVGGIPDFLKDGETGVFCEPKNPRSIANAVKRLLSDEGLRRKLIENGQKLVREKYDWDLIAGEMKVRVFDLPAVGR